MYSGVFVYSVPSIIMGIGIVQAIIYESDIGLIVMVVGGITLFVLINIAVSDFLRRLDVKYGCVSS